jgi:ethanolamine utilization protein EutA (predicted chaperonin)
VDVRDTAVLNINEGGDTSNTAVLTVREGEDESDTAVLSVGGGGDISEVKRSFSQTESLHAYRRYIEKLVLKTKQVCFDPHGFFSFQYPEQIN